MNALWPPDGHWYDARVQHISSAKVTVLFDDGVERSLWPHQVGLSQ